MYQIQLLKVTGQASASAAGTVVCELEPGYRYHDLTMCLTAASSALTVNYPNESRLKVNGTVQRSVTPNNLDLLNQLNNPAAFLSIRFTAGAAAAATPSPYSAYLASATQAFVKHFFSEPWNTPEVREYSALDLLPEDTASIEVPFASVTPAPTVTFVASVTPLSEVVARRAPFNSLNRVNGRPTLVKISTGSATPGAATLDITQINKTFSAADAVQHLRFANPTSRTIDRVQITVNDREIFNRTASENLSDLYNAGLSTLPLPAAGAGYFDIVPNASGNRRDGWVWTPNDKVNAKLTFDASASAAVAYHVQRFGVAD